MNAERLRAIFQAGLLPFIQDIFPDGHRLQQDNDPKHASNLIDHFLKNMGVSTGGPLHLNLRILTRLKMCGVRSNSTSINLGI